MATSGFSYKPFKKIEIATNQTTAFGAIQVAQIVPTAQTDFVFGPGRIIVVACKASNAVTDNTLSVNWFEQQ